MKKWNELPVEIQEKMLEHQKTQTGIRDESVFEEYIFARKYQGGFDWEDTPGKLNFWSEIIYHGNFDLFYERYPKEENKDKRFPLVAKSKRSGNVMCFTSENEGICIYSTFKSIGSCERLLISCFDKESWTIIAQPSEYPKEMYVSDESEEIALHEKNQQTIIAYSDFERRYVDENTCSWLYAVDIPEEKPKSDLELELEELKARVKQLEEKLHN